jgi:hypothetical protein
MTSDTAAETVKKSRALERFEIIATILLALATVATAWSSYQANRWNGEQAKAAAKANGLRIESAKAAGRANTFGEIDLITFTQWVDAYANDDTEVADFYEARFRPEFKVAFDAWIATNPLTTPGAPPSPFAMDEYVRADDVESDRLQTESEAAAAQARENIQRSSNYVLAVVLFAASLFFAGLSARFQTPNARRAILAIGMIVFIATTVWVATFPVSASV